MRILDASTIAGCLPWPALIDALGAGLSCAVTAPPRHYHAMEGGDDFLLLMPAWSDRWVGVKTAAVFPDNPARGGEVVAESYLLIDRHTGRPAALLDGFELTNRRTAAASALAAKALAREDAEILLVMGTGGLAPYMAAAHAAIRPYRRILIWGRSLAKAETIAAALRAQGLPAEAAMDAQSAMGVADTISCVTGATAPILLGRWLKPGTHVDLVGAHRPEHREADSDAVSRAGVWADVRDNVLREAGDILIPIGERRFKAADIKGELADLVGQHPAECRAGLDITLFKSVGFAAEDLVAATLAFDAAGP